MSKTKKILGLVNKVSNGFLFGLLALRFPSMRVGVSESERVVEIDVPVYGYFEFLFNGKNASVQIKNVHYLSRDFNSFMEKILQRNLNNKIKMLCYGIGFGISTLILYYRLRNSHKNWILFFKKIFSWKKSKKTKAKSMLFCLKCGKNPPQIMLDCKHLEYCSKCFRNQFSKQIISDSKCDKIECSICNKKSSNYTELIIS
jgi:hypothetical protein